MRELIAFDCAGETLLGTLDGGKGTTGLLIVSGGNEIRVGAHRGMAQLAQRLAARGIPVFRFDRRGIGDSTGDNRGWAESGPDIAAAAALFRERAPHLTRLIAFGNCDAATALVLFGGEAGIEGLILSNPWVIDDGDDLPPVAAIRARYAERLRDPSERRRLLSGGVDLRKLMSGVRKVLTKPPKTPDSLADRVFGALPHDATVILAERDATARAFADEAARRHWPGAIVTIDTASHSYARAGDADALVEAIVAALG